MTRILLDENVNVKLKHQLVGFEVKTVYDLGVAKLTNGALLAFARDKVDVVLTHDRGIPFQHNHHGQKLVVIALASTTTSLTDVEPLIPKLVQLIRDAPMGQVATLSPTGYVVHV